MSSSLHCNDVSQYLEQTIRKRDLNVSHTLGCVGRNNSKSSIGSSGHTGVTRPGQT